MYSVRVLGHLGAEEVLESYSASSTIGEVSFEVVSLNNVDMSLVVYDAERAAPK